MFAMQIREFPGSVVAAIGLRAGDSHIHPGSTQGARQREKGEDPEFADYIQKLAASNPAV